MQTSLYSTLTANMQADRLLLPTNFSGPGIAGGLMYVCVPCPDHNS